MNSNPRLRPHPGPGRLHGAGRGTQTFRGTLAVWIQALRAPFLVASGFPVAVGAAAASWRTGELHPGRFVLSLLGVLSVHLGANLANDYFDEATGCDRGNPEPTPFSGGSRVIQCGLVSARRVMFASAMFFAAGAAFGLILNAMIPGNRVLWLGVLGVAGGFAYTAPPLCLSYRGLGEAAVFALFGPLAATGGYVCQTGRLGALPVAVSVPMGLLVVAILIANEVLDLKWDRRAGKRTLVVRLGRERGYALFLLTYFASFAWLALGIGLRFYPAWAAPALLVPAVCARSLVPRNALGTREATINASRLAILSHTAAGSVVVAAYLL